MAEIKRQSESKTTRSTAESVQAFIDPDNPNQLYYINEAGERVNIGDSPAGLKRYVAVVTQQGTNDPTAVVLENTLGGDPVWSRTGIGSIELTLAGIFTPRKTTIIVGGADESQSNSVFNYSTDLATQPDAVSIFTFDDGGSASDDLIVNTPVIITVYP